MSDSKPPALTFIEVPGWPRPRGYSNGVVGAGRTLHIAGQIGWLPDGSFPSDDLIGQFATALDNLVAVVRAAGGTPDCIASMTAYVTEMDTYRARAAELGPIWKASIGRHFPAMALVAVTSLVEPRAKIEISAVAHLPPL
jgi:enamine deaminase RidA (YjgF/YER057c/UK114 family)